MHKKVGKQTIIFTERPRIVGNYTIVGPKEGKGNFAKYFHKILDDDKLGQDSYEKAERKMLLETIKNAISSSKLKNKDIDVLIAGDLLSQIISSSFSARELSIPYLGVFGACSTMVESLIVGASLVEGGFCEHVACATGSHFASAEKQFRYPLELGTQRPPTSQWTVTASGCSILASKGTGVKVCKATIGKVVDWNVKDANNMGGAMAPAAMETLCAFFEDTHTKPDDYDLILTGDLGKLGSEVLIDLMEHKGYKLGKNYNDCGQIMFNNTQKVFMGASGCGCMASILNSYVLKRFKNKTLKNCLCIATGALLSPVSTQQGDSIPCIAHLVLLEGDDDVWYFNVFKSVFDWWICLFAWTNFNNNNQNNKRKNFGKLSCIRCSFTNDRCIWANKRILRFRHNIANNWFWLLACKGCCRGGVRRRFGRDWWRTYVGCCGNFNCGAVGIYICTYFPKPNKENIKFILKLVKAKF